MHGLCTRLGFLGIYRVWGETMYQQMENKMETLNPKFSCALRDGVAQAHSARWRVLGNENQMSYSLNSLKGDI